MTKQEIIDMAEAVGAVTCVPTSSDAAVGVRECSAHICPPALQGITPQQMLDLGRWFATRPQIDTDQYRLTIWIGNVAVTATAPRPKATVLTAEDEINALCK